MASSNKFSFIEEEQRSIIQRYSDTVEEITQASQAFVENVSELCTRVRYKPVVDFTNACIDFYNESLVTQIKSNHDKWQESEGSLAAFIKAMDGGQEAEDTAKQMQQNLKQEFEERFGQLDKLTIDISQPDIGEEDYQKLADFVKKYKDNVQEIYDKEKTAIDNASEDNKAYSTIKGVVAATASGIMSSFEEIEKKVGELEGEFAERTGKVVQTAEDVSEALRNQADTSARDLFNEVAAQFGGEL